VKQNPLKLFASLRQKFLARRDELQRELAEIEAALGSAPIPSTGPMPAAFTATSGHASGGKRAKRKITRSAAWYKAVREAQQRRRERERGETPASNSSANGAPPTSAKKKGGMTAEQKAKISAAQKKRWAERRKKATKAY
jgi:hypothetical protein